MATAPDSPEYQTFKKCTADLVTAIQSEVGQISDNLYSEGFISKEVWKYTQIPAIPDTDKARKIVAAVSDKIELDAKVFHDILEKSLIPKEIVSKLKEVYNQPRQKNPSTSSTPVSVDDKTAVSTPESQFPYLNVEGMSENEKYSLENKLLSQTQAIKGQFHILLKSLQESLKQQIRSSDNPVEKLDEVKEVILDFSCIEKKHKEAIEAAPYVLKIFNILRASEYITFFNYYIVEELVKKFGDQKQLDAYVNKLKIFCERSVFEVPKSVFACEPREGAKVLAFKCTEHVSTLKDVQRKMRELVDFFSFAGANLSDFQLCTIKKGCVELHFLVSAAVAERVFSVTPSQHSALSKIGVRVIDPQRSRDNQPLLPSYFGLVKTETTEEQSEKDKSGNTEIGARLVYPWKRTVTDERKLQEEYRRNLSQTADSYCSEDESFYSAVDDLSIDDPKIQFPYLDVKGLSDYEIAALKRLLVSDTRKISYRFYKFSDAILSSLEANSSVGLERVKAVILNEDCIEERHKEEIKQKDETIKVFNILRAGNYITFFNYYIVENLVKHFGSDEDHKKLDAYLEELGKFCERSVFQVPKSVFDCKARSKDKILALKCTEDVISLNKVREIMCDLVEIFLDVKLSHFQLCTIKEGCVELHFLVSAAVAERVFPVTPSQHSALSEIGVRVIDPQESRDDKDSKSALLSTESTRSSPKKHSTATANSVLNEAETVCSAGSSDDSSDELYQQYERQSRRFNTESSAHRSLRSMHQESAEVF